jgi:hypothetical protein
VKLLFTFFLLESKRVFGRRNIIILLVVFLLSLYFVQIGLNRYKDFNVNKEKFKNIEKIKVNSYINFQTYSLYGFRLLFNPSPLSIFFVNSSVISDLTANVDSGERLYIYNSFKGRTLFAEKSGGFKDFSGIILLLGTLLVLYFGYDAFLYKNFSRFLSGFVHPTRVFLSIVVSRLLFLGFYFIVTMSCSFFLVKLNGLKLSKHEVNSLFLYLAVMLLMLIFFFLFGTIAGALKSRFLGFLTMLVVWFIFVFLIPGVLRSVISSEADNITPTYNLELQKLRALMNFEKNVLKKAGRYSEQKAQTKKGRNIIENFWNNEFKKIINLENKVSNETYNNIRLFYKLSLVAPTTYYISVGNEISSKGYKNFIDFFSYILDLKEKFVRFYIQKRYYSLDSRVISFVKSDENIFYARSRLPDYLWVGFILNILFSAFLGLVALIFFKKSLQK